MVTTFGTSKNDEEFVVKGLFNYTTNNAQSMLNAMDGNDMRPGLPPRPSQQSDSQFLLSTSSPTSSSQFPASQYGIDISRSLPQSSVGLGSYHPVQAAEGTESPSTHNNDFEDSIYRPIRGWSPPTEGHLPPKAFYKTHYLFWWNLGYWRQPVRHGFLGSLLFLAVFLPCYYSSYGFSTIINSSEIAPFNYDCKTSPGWSFVGINIRFGRFSFGQAKAIDLAWNWIIGRGYQGVLTLLMFRVFSDALLRSAEITAVPFELYATLALPATKIELIYRLFKGLFRYGNGRVKFIFAWLLFSTFYLLAVPTLMDAATAYESNQITVFSWPNNNTESSAPLKEFAAASDAVTPIPICMAFTSGMGGSLYSFPSYKYDVKRWNFSYLQLPADNTSPERKVIGNCDNFTTYIEGTNYTERAFFPRFSLWNWADSSINKTWWDKFEKGGDPLEALDPNRWTDWKFYPTLQTSYRCVIELNLYQWGFSFEWLFLITIINSVFLVGTWILWVDCDTNSQLCRVRRRLGVWRAITDLAEAVREELGPNICAYSEEELVKVLKKRPPIKYVATWVEGFTEGDEDGAKAMRHLGLSSNLSKGDVPDGKKFEIDWGKAYGHFKED